MRVELVKLGRKGQITIPKSILRAVGISNQTPLIVEASGDGTIVLRPAGVYPIEFYTDERIQEFEKLNTVPPPVDARVEAFLRKKKKKNK